MRPTVVIGIDPGTYCGWAVLDAVTGDRIASGTWNLQPRRHEGGGMRYVHFDAHFGALLDAYDVRAVAYEEVRRHAGTDAAHIYGGIVAHLGSACERRALPYEGVPVGTVKKQATGKGNADKTKMLLAAALRWHGHEFRSADDEADACWIAEAWRVANIPNGRSA